MRSRTRRRGTASVEIVVMLPVFIVAFYGIYHLHKVGIAALAAHERARGCAFQFAVQGCRDADRGAGLCADVQAGKTERIEQPATAKADHEKAGLDEAMSDKIEKIPLVGALWTGIFGEGSQAVSTVETPRFREQGKSSLTAGHYMVCNTVAKTWEQLRREQLCGLVKQLGINGKVLGC